MFIVGDQRHQRMKFCGELRREVKGSSEFIQTITVRHGIKEVRMRMLFSKEKFGTHEAE